MKFGNSIIKMVILTIAIVSTSVGYAQWGGILGGLLQAAGERWIDNSSYSSQDKDNMRNVLNYFSDEAKANQSARNAAKDAYEGNYTGAVIQGAQTLLNATGNYSYDTYLNSANQINNANREYKRDLQNGMDSQEALDKRNTSFGYSTAESVIELQDRIARERIEKARQQREAERQLWESSNNYATSSYYETSTGTTSGYSEANIGTETSNPNVFGEALIAHINTAAVLDAMPDKVRAEKDLENYYGELQNQLQAIVNEYQTKIQYYEANQTTMSDFVKQSKEREIVDLQTRIQQFQANAESEFEAKRTELLRPILSKIQNAINTVASETGLSYVIDISTGAAVFLGEESIDITYMVMKKLGF
ncbi:MAG: OmpH family outer membrane protein [Bacteroidales bacterium]|nr:OmpH family outer membrane protein [Bacteroidales bacterium]